MLIPSFFAHWQVTALDTSHSVCSPPAAVAPRPAGSACGSEEALERQVLKLERAFGQSFYLYDTARDTVHRLGSDCLHIDIHSRLEVCDQSARRQRAEVIEDFAPLLTISVPLLEGEEASAFVAVSTFLTSAVESVEDMEAAARQHGVGAVTAFGWAGRRQVWNPTAISELATALLCNEVYEARLDRQQQQLSEVSSHLLSTFEELSMLHRLSERLSIASSDEELAERAVEWLAEVLPAECIAVVRYTASDHPTPDGAGTRAEAVVHGECPFEASRYGHFLDSMGPEVVNRCLVLGDEFTSSPTWSYPGVKQVITVPIRSGESVLGWMVAINRSRCPTDDASFTAVEASLLSSVAAILGVHTGNCKLYAEQKEFFSGMVRALSSAIDAKDPYTSGHSDRVARLSVCLARELGCNDHDLSTIYLAGLLHDIGKIGIEDRVLRKAGRLTPEEYDHIKTHPELGFRILQGVRQLEQVLPVVLHHHETWDGAGYPHGLKGSETPRLARIVAVADAIDAMSSDRPYREGISDERLYEILRVGAGKQWDAEVIEAVFRVRDQIQAIRRSDRAPQALDVREWQL